MQNAPVVTLHQGEQCIPQHYLTYRHDLASVEQIVKEIRFDPHYPLFVCHREQQLYLQVGIVGDDNYPKPGKVNHTKIVYGRKWRVEPQLPTSEIVQTAFLALVKAREHEVRERFRFSLNGRVTTPFNTHHDAPLMAQLSADGVFSCQQKPVVRDGSSVSYKEEVQSWLDAVTYDHGSLQVEDVIPRPDGRFLVDLSLCAGSDTTLPEITGETFGLLLNMYCPNVLYYSLMDHFLLLSQRYIEEHFSYKGFKRFSRQNSIQRIAQLSYLTRQREAQRGQLDNFEQHFSEANYETDVTRVPSINDSEYGKRLREQLSGMDIREGILPLDV